MARRLAADSGRQQASANSVAFECVVLVGVQRSDCVSFLEMI